MAQPRKQPLVSGNCYHIFSRSIAKYQIFNSSVDYKRFLEILNLYRYADFRHSFSKYIQLDVSTQASIILNLKTTNSQDVEIVAYCIMPTHFHLILRQVSDSGISKYMSKILNCYARHFNIKHQRLGPLWAGRFKSVLVSSDEQLLHLTRYLHLNPTSAGLVKTPKSWEYSSYNEYINPEAFRFKLCEYSDLLEIKPKQYAKFVNNNKDYQRSLSLIKYQIIDDYAG
jgi:putative transposase